MAVHGNHNPNLPVAIEVLAQMLWSWDAVVKLHIDHLGMLKQTYGKVIV